MLCQSDAIKFPFLTAASQYAKQISITSLLEDEQILQKIDNYLFEIFSKKFHSSSTNEDIETTMKLFIGTLLVINQIRKQRLIYKFAAVEAAYYISKLKNILNKDGFDNFDIYFDIIFEDIYGKPNFIRRDGKEKFVLKVPQYLQLWSKCGDKKDEYKLINQVVDRGQVIFNQHVLFALLEGGIKAFLVKKIEGLKIETDLDVQKRRVKPSKFHPPITLTNPIKNLISKYEYIDIFSSVHRHQSIETLKDKKEFNTDQLIQGIVKLKQGKTPPCISHVIDKFNKGENVSHFERLTLATFLITKEESIESITEIFSHARNFNEKITGYQLNQIKNGGYKTPSCDKINDNSFCFRAADICGNIRNPIQLLLV